jgi:hypothetical protein
MQTREPHWLLLLQVLPFGQVELAAQLVEQLGPE